MVSFNLNLEIDQHTVELTVEQLDHIADVEGFIRYDVQTGDRRAVVYVNIQNQAPFGIPADDAGDAFEALHDPTETLAFSTEGDFSAQEVQDIGEAIRQYNEKLRISFHKFMSREAFLDL